MHTHLYIHLMLQSINSISITEPNGSASLVRKKDHLVKPLNGLCLGGSCLWLWTPWWAKAEPVAFTQEHHQLVIMLLSLCGRCINCNGQGMDRAGHTLFRLPWDSRWNGTHSGGSPRILLLSTVTTTTFLCAKQLLLSHWATFQAPCFVVWKYIFFLLC